MRRSALLAATAAAAVAGTVALQALPGTTPVARADGLVGYDDCADLLSRYRAELVASVTEYGYGGGELYATASTVGGAEAARSSADSGAVGSGATGTNLQEQGVDEPDLAKLRDGRLVLLTGNTLRIVSAEAQPRLLGSLRLGGRPEAYGGELLLVGDLAVVVQSGWREVEPTEAKDGDGADAARMIYRPGVPTTRVVLVDLAADDPRLLEEATYDGQYVSARLVDGTVRMVTTTRPALPVVYPETGHELARRAALTANRNLAADVSLDDVLPRVVRTDAAGSVLARGRAVDCADVYHAVRARGASTLLVTTLRPESDRLDATDSTAVTTDGDLVYASADRLYVATSRWGTVGPVRPMDDVGRLGGRDVVSPDEVETELHGFDTSSATETSYVGSGSVPGYVMGRWALSHHEGVLRVATTRQPPWDGERTGETSSMVVKLEERDGRLVETGRVAGLGKTEHIRAVRYFGDIAAVVTFRQTDPLYLLDLSGDPKVLGELKVPGFSTYLHPLGDGLLLGLGQEATEQGQVTGAQVSVFDVSDLSNPRQVDRLQLGNGWSPALDDSRAFSYDPERRLATFAFTAYDEAYNQQSNAALGIRVGDDGSLSMVGELDLGAETWASRVFVDDGLVHAVTDHSVVAGDAATYAPTGSLDLR